MDVLSIAILTAALSSAGTERTASELSREWTDASGARRAHAVLLSVDDGTVWLQRADGKRVTSRLDNLSAADRHYVAARRASLDTAPKLSTAIPALNRHAEFVKPLEALASWVGSSQSEIERRPAPAALV